jgi:DNA polymerase-3 subunit delta'
MSDDDLPEADRIEGASHPRETPDLFGQQDAENAFLAAWTEGRQHHAWLLSGPRGIGKATLAWRIARFLRSQSGDDPGLFGDAPAPTTLDTEPDHPIARRMTALSDPGTLLIRRTWDADRKKLKAQITVDEVRKLNAFFGLSAPDGGNRVVIVDSADDMNPSAANALLKVLEEPPANATLLLVSHQPARLLPTIRSRCRMLRLSPLGPEPLAQALNQAGVDVPDGAALAELAAGSAGEAIRMIEQDGPSIYAGLMHILSSAPDMDRQAVLAFAEQSALRGAEDRLHLTLRLMDLALVRLARSGAGHPPSQGAAPQETDVLAKLSATAPRHWADLQEKLSARLRHGLAVNVDAASLITDALLQINETARGG